MSHLCVAVKFAVGTVLAWVRFLVIEELDEVVVSTGNESTQKGTNPVYPVIVLEIRTGYARAEGTCRVEGRSGLEVSGQYRQLRSGRNRRT